MSYRYPATCSDCGWPESRKVTVSACPVCGRNVCHVCRESFHVETDTRLDCPNCGPITEVDADGWCAKCSATPDVIHVPWSERTETEQSEPEQERRAS